jgi:hypothetical protein
MNRFFLLCLTLAVIVSCDKDKFETVPQVRIKSTTGREIPASGALKVTLEVTDKQGDVDDSLYIFRERLNQRGVSRRLLPYKIPEFPDKPSVEVEIVLDYATELTLALSAINVPGSVPPKRETDTLRLKFIVKDKAGNWSDTAVLNDIYVAR